MKDRRLTRDELTLFHLLCCLEESDRERPVVTAIWPRAWRQVGRKGRPPELGQILDTVILTGFPATTDDAVGRTASSMMAEAGRKAAGEKFCRAARAAAASYWTEVRREASGGGSHSLNTERLVQASLAAIPYLIDLERWALIVACADDVFRWEPWRGNEVDLLSVVPQLGELVPGATITFARGLASLHRAAAIDILLVYEEVAHKSGILLEQSGSPGPRGEFADARAAFRLTAVAKALLSRLYRDAGDMVKAAGYACEMGYYSDKASLGPWSKLHAEVLETQALAEGDDLRIAHENKRRRALETIEELVTRTSGTPVSAITDANEISTHWEVLEAIHNTLREVLIQLGRHEDALASGARLQGLLRARHASTASIAQAQIADYQPLLRLGRINQARKLLEQCSQALGSGTTALWILAKVNSGLAETDDAEWNGDGAIRLQLQALRYSYKDGNAREIAASHDHLGGYLAKYASAPDLAFANHLAAALIQAMIAGHSVASKLNAAALLREHGPAVTAPANIAGLARQAGHQAGADLPGLLARIASDWDWNPEDALSSVIADVREVAEDDAWWRDR